MIISTALYISGIRFRLSRLANHTVMTEADGRLVDAVSHDDATAAASTFWTALSALQSAASVLNAKQRVAA